jgi:hypothetical protein
MEQVREHCRETRIKYNQFVETAILEHLAKVTNNEGK